MRALVVPSLHAGPEDHWYPALRLLLERQGYDVAVAAPPPGEPVLADWLAAIGRADVPLDAATLVVGHSLGAVAALAHLSAAAPATVGCFVGVAPFAQPLPDLPTTDAFVAATAPDLVRTVVRRRHVLLSEDDYAVPPAMVERAAAAIGAELHRFAAAGHFLERDGWRDPGPIAALAP